ncbi:hypothetical protein ACERIT_05095 [Halopenitus sp. H-Gu1]|uniref:hypothetical protein n=1 Tax=Halopenitus sp. H-Gu1 TaxID=3242697 RepID=UPI00359E3072
MTGVIAWLRDRFGRAPPEPNDDEEEDGGRARLSRPYVSPGNSRRTRGISGPIEKFYVPTAVLRETQRFIEAHGAEETEAYVFWAGAVTDGEAYITTCVYPTANARHGGVKVPLRKMTEINLELRDRDQLVLAQVHSHPGVARHSPVDEEKAVSFHEGFVSIVVPDFGETPVYDLRDCGVYVYTATEGWRLLDDGEIEDQFVIEETVLEV